MSERTQLEEISIKGIGVIEEATINFSPGFTVLTGETGAGKTMILTALALVLGGKSDASLVRQGKERLIATASFSITTELTSELNDLGADVEEGSLILTRTVTNVGKSKSSAGGVSVPVGTLSEIGERLIEVHAQAASMSITKSIKQREILDRFAGAPISSCLSSYKESFETVHDLRNRIAALAASVADRDAEVSRLKEFADAFAKLKIVLGEHSALVNDIERLGSVEDLREGASVAQVLFTDEEKGIVTALGQVRRALEAIASKDLAIAQIAESVTEAFYLIEEASISVSTYLEDLEADPVRLDSAQNRRSEIVSFIKRFGKAGDPDEQIAELIARNSIVRDSISDLVGGDDRLSTMKVELEIAMKELHKRAKLLSQTRVTSASTLSSLVSEEIHSLSMPHTQFSCVVESPDYSTALPISAFTSTGCDEISMVLQGHKDGPFVPVAKGASGGELSRVMLALEVVLAKSEPVGTYVFDEVDAGVGGKAAVEVGRRLHELSTHAQVIVVTHLPQVAAWADSHFVVNKSVDGTVVQSGVSEVQGDARVAEIARMLAGHEESKSAQEHATELLEMRR